jgi:curved DNA-binding protein CbpA
MAEIDPYKLFKLPKVFTLEQLRSSYKKLAIAMHPDKPSGSEYLFKHITMCYKQLAKEHQRNQVDKSYFDLKDQYTNYVDVQEQEKRQNVSMGNGVSASKKSREKTVEPERFSGKNFDRNKFNQVFAEHRLDNAHDHGYGEWMSSSSKQREDIEIKNVVGKFNEGSFNKAFDRIKVHKDKSVVRFNEPEALPLTRNVEFSELGVSKIEDFGDKLSNKTLSFSDYRRAHSTTRLIDVDSAMKARKQFDSVDHLEAERDRISYDMDSRTRRLYDRRQKDMERQEHARSEYQRVQDRLYAKQYEMMNKLMLR